MVDINLDKNNYVCDCRQCFELNFLVLEGYKTWRDSGSDVAELLLISLGMDANEAYQIARSDLPALKEL